MEEGTTSEDANNVDRNRLRPLKITVVGDGNVGKSSLLFAYTQKFRPEYFRTGCLSIYDNHAKVKNVDGIEYALTLWDTAGQEEFEKLRTLLYPKTDCFLLCYAIDNKASFANIQTKWMPELKHHCPNATIILVGTKSDEKDSKPDVITEKEGKSMMRKIKANGFFQCSTKTRDGLEELFIEAVREIMKPNKAGCCKVV